METGDEPGRADAPLRPRWRRWFARACVAAAFVLGPLAWLIVDGLREETPPADVAVILGNKVYPSGVPSPHLRDRLARGLALYQAGTVRYLLVSGGLGREGHQEAEVMGAWLVRRGVPAERVIEDPEGVTTHATARNTARIFEARGWRTALVVSQYYHLTRCKLALRRAGVEVVGCAHADVNLTKKEPYSLLREVAGLYYYALRQDV